MLLYYNSKCVYYTSWFTFHITTASAKLYSCFMGFPFLNDNFPFFSYRYCKNKPYPKSRFCRGVPGKKSVPCFAEYNSTLKRPSLWAFQWAVLWILSTNWENIFLPQTKHLQRTLKIHWYSNNIAQVKLE